MTAPALVASDLDGTLLRTDRTVGPRTLGTLDRLREQGIPFVMVTGRPIRWLAEVLRFTGPRGPVVCSNGAVVYDPESGTVLDDRPLRPDLLAEVAERLRAEYPGVAFAAETADGLAHEPAYPIREVSPAVRVADLPRVVAEPAVKLLAWLDHPVPTQLAAAMTDSLRGVAEVTRSSEDSLIEISAAGVTKATGLARVAERYEVAPADIVAFGDMPNDLPMFAYVGHSVAMANAEPAVRAAAHTVTTSNDDDGVAQYLTGLLDAAPIA
ncbi:HAD family hydrolase [Actinocatenispora rupis]|uniref:Haloacid dehalogenase n=1 Tax=Actinocatenispora rupis TaxID=519421 RepID=A0A8J3NB82_9ACTN|nr:HAD family hydrolase [Actinocatenispora rupis]GID13099.1 haloacid dehalogenase [Actinocatenispora rupis]